VGGDAGIVVVGGSDGEDGVVHLCGLSPSGAASQRPYNWMAQQGGALTTGSRGKRRPCGWRAWSGPPRTVAIDFRG
jgi:hypothetical protein